MSQIVRLTLFPIDPADFEFVQQAFQTMYISNRKDGKPYMISCTAYKLHEDPRSNGFTVAARTRFASLEDMRFYDDECPAHKGLKEVIKPKIKGPPMTIYFDA